MRAIALLLVWAWALIVTTATSLVGWSAGSARADGIGWDGAAVMFAAGSPACFLAMTTLMLRRKPWRSLAVPAWVSATHAVLLLATFYSFSGF